MNSKLIWVVDHPRKKKLSTIKKKKKKLNTLNKHLSPLKIKFDFLQNFGLLKIEPKICEKCYIHNIFTTNLKW